MPATIAGLDLALEEGEKGRVEVALAEVLWCRGGVVGAEGVEDRWVGLAEGALVVGVGGVGFAEVVGGGAGTEEGEEVVNDLGCGCV